MTKFRKVHRFFRKFYCFFGYLDFLLYLCTHKDNSLQHRLSEESPVLLTIPSRFSVEPSNFHLKTKCDNLAIASACIRTTFAIRIFELC